MANILGNGRMGLIRKLDAVSLQVRALPSIAAAFGVAIVGGIVAMWFRV